MLLDIIKSLEYTTFRTTPWVFFKQLETRVTDFLTTKRTGHFLFVLVEVGNGHFAGDECVASCLELLVFA